MWAVVWQRVPAGSGSLGKKEWMILETGQANRSRCCRFFLDFIYLEDMQGIWERKEEQPQQQ